MNPAAMTTFVTLALLVSFASLATVHVAIVYSLVAKRQGWRAAVAALVPPLAPWLAIRQGMRVRGALWLGWAVLYAVSLALAW